MTKTPNYRLFTGLLGASLLALTTANQAQAQVYPHTPNQQFVPAMQGAPIYRSPNINHNVQQGRYSIAPRQMIPAQNMTSNGRYAIGPSPTHPRNMRRMTNPAKPQNFLDKLFKKNKFAYANSRDQWHGKRLPQYQMRPVMPHPLDQFQSWNNAEPEYRLYPGDQVDIVVGSAPELSRTLTVGPDGRVVMPMTKPVMAAGRTMSQVQADLSAQLATQLRDPRIDVTPRAYGPQQIFVGGEVAAQGTYTLPGPIGAMEAVLMAGGFRTSAQMRQVVILRRAPNGGFMARTVDFRDGLQNIRSFADNVQMKRGDIIFVPRTDIAEVGLFMQNFRGALPFDLSLSYNLGDNFQNN